MGNYVLMIKIIFNIITIITVFVQLPFVLYIAYIHLTCLC